MKREKRKMEEAMCNKMKEGGEGKKEAVQESVKRWKERRKYEAGGGRIG
jgi:hypothetical protein